MMPKGRCMRISRNDGETAFVRLSSKTSTSFHISVYTFLVFPVQQLQCQPLLILPSSGCCATLQQVAHSLRLILMKEKREAEILFLTASSVQPLRGIIFNSSWKRGA